MDYKQVKDNAKAGVVNNGLNNTDDPVTFEVAEGLGSRFPDTAEGEFLVTAFRPALFPDPLDDPQMEVLNVTNRTGDSFTADRNAGETGGLHAHTAGTEIRLEVMAKHIRDLQEDVDSILNPYIDLVINTFTNNKQVNEKGQTITEILFQWTYNDATDPAISQNIDNGIGDIPVPNLSKLATGLNITTDTTFTLTASNGVTDPDPTKQTSVVFRNRRYWGVNDSATIDNDGILALSNSELATNRLTTKTFDCSGNEPDGNYIWICYPKSWGQGEFWLNGFLTEFQKNELSFTNAYGHTEDYYAYRSPNPYNGDNIVVEVK